MSTFSNKNKKRVIIYEANDYPVLPLFFQEHEES